ncbi:hypothetical protein PoB_000164800 [Plakobranchus ocellatus]|uniref:Uncharacterized protein n=1 Tax=Plakobranchus ocellatus TaxID=259542 RepID=A0AAV3XYS4_9GAST|nr:hypothetical protein PoB_000164800 [Plakobranchus ocellatus]
MRTFVREPRSSHRVTKDRLSPGLKPPTSGLEAGGDNLGLDKVYSMAFVYTAPPQQGDLRLLGPRQAKTSAADKRATEEFLQISGQVRTPLISQRQWVGGGARAETRDNRVLVGLKAGCAGQCTTSGHELSLNSGRENILRLHQQWPGVPVPRENATTIINTADLSDLLTLSTLSQTAET